MEKTKREIALETGLSHMLGLACGYRDALRVLCKRSGVSATPHQIENDIYEECKKLLGEEHFKRVAGTDGTS